jgi:hypothetical protein
LKLQRSFLIVMFQILVELIIHYTWNCPNKKKNIEVSLFFFEVFILSMHKLIEYLYW